MRTLILVAAAALMASSAVSAQTLDRIRERGKVVIGLKTDFRPFGFIDANGQHVGLEIDLANDLAARLKVDVEKVSVTSAQRIEALQQGRVDMILATLSDNAQRRTQVGMIEPFYYSGGSALMTKQDSPITWWDDVRNRKLCGTQGAYYNPLITARYGADVITFPNIGEAQAALLDGKCEGFLQDSTLLAAAVQDPRWKDYHSPLPVEDEVGWNIAVPMAERDGPWGQFIKETIIDWHRKGIILDLEKKWGLKPTSSLVSKLNKEYQKK